jgi:acyl-CoA synthetase (AMP-forming)/AMP-acid ligase II
MNDPQAIAAACVNGWFRTGDLGHLHDEAYVVGRIKDLINRGGEQISPVEIDAAIEAVPGIREVRRWQKQARRYERRRAALHRVEI